MSLIVPMMKEETNDFRNQSQLVYDYLQSEKNRHFGEYEDIKLIAEREEILIDQLRRICDRDSHYLLNGKLFSRIITSKMSHYNSSLHEGYLFQKNFSEMFKKLYEKTRLRGSDEQESEIKAAKILWNLIQENKYDEANWALLKDHDQNSTQLSPTKNREFMIRYNVEKNLINIVQGNVFNREPPSSAYQEASIQVNKAISLYKSKRFKQMTMYFELALKKIQEFEGIEGAAIFTTTVGSLLIQKSENITKGLYFLKRGEDLYEKLDDKRRYGESLGEMATAFWTLGMYKKALDKLSTEIYIQTLQENDLAIMYSQEKLSHFFRNLSRFIESQEWALNYLNSAVRSSNDQMRGLYFLNANLNYARTLIGLNAWPKVEAHLNYADRALNQLNLPNNQVEKITLDISCMKGHMNVIRGQFDEAEIHFAVGKTTQSQFDFNSPIYARFLRAEATLLRNQRKFPQAIKIMQPLFQDKKSMNPRNVTLLAELLALHAHENEALKLLNHAKEVLSRWNSLQGISRIFLSMGYIHLLLGDFSESKKWYQQALEIIGTDIGDLKVTFDANVNLAYIALENKEITPAKQYTAIAEECASMSGSLAYLLDSQLLKASLRMEQGKRKTAENFLKRILNEAQKLEIDYILQKAKFRLDQL
ncbi:MAG: hypothetical protein ACFE9L_11905 [Candidatus Hodarchaeota archaeon]